MSAPPLARNYALVASAALAVATLLMLVEGPGVWSLLPALIGAIGIALRWAIGPPLFLFALGLLTAFDNALSGMPWNHRQPDTLPYDLSLAAAVLAFFAAHYRLCSAYAALPPDKRRAKEPKAARARGRWLLPTGPTRRTTARGFGGELGRLLLSLPVFVLVAAQLWMMLEQESSPEPRAGLSAGGWRLIVAAWVLAVALVVASALLGYLSRATAGREESLLYLQDQLWTATRGEQRRVARWLAWARLRAWAKKEG